MSALDFNPSRLDVSAFTRAGAQLQGELALSKLERFAQDAPDLQPDSSQKLHWQAHGESRPLAGGAPQAWLHLDLQAQVPMQCQRCLRGMTHDLDVSRSFRFVRDETEALAQDDEAEEDLLVTSKRFDLLELVEDEFIMALPMVPMHDEAQGGCPVSLKAASSDEDFQAALDAKPKAFAALGELKKAKGKAG